MSSPKCFNCKYYYVSWDQYKPRGCRAHGFISKEMPALMVKKSSGQDCLAFEEKKRKNQKEEPLDLSRNDLW